jgi:diadenosine tetraphosphatase ApaH/serine/threonine PP2A family protein phosphatase
LKAKLLAGFIKSQTKISLELKNDNRQNLTRVWQRFNALFNWMPLAAVIDGKILCMHGT